MLAAGDTYRAAGVRQLQLWGERIGCPVFARDTGSDAAALAFDALADEAAAREIGAAGLATCSERYSPEVVLEAVQHSYARALAEVGDE